MTRLPAVLAGRAALAGLLASAALLVGACGNVPYYWQALNGEMEILHKRRPIAEVLQDPSVREDVKERLRLAGDVEGFSVTGLSLPAKGAYRYYADLGRPFVSWLVVAAPAVEMREYTWCYLIVGCLGYRGYFAKADADALAAGLRAEGYDVLVRPVRAFSTLGWFDDPLLNTFLSQDPLDVMATLIHEQAHRRLWVNGDTEFNESFAVFVEHEGLRRYLEKRPPTAEYPALPPVSMARYEAYCADQERFESIAMEGRRRLVELYASALPDADKLEGKTRVLAGIREDYQKQRPSFKLLNYDDWFGAGLNNAYFVGIAQYHVRVDAFAALFDEQGRDFKRFYAASEALGKLSPAERHAALNRLAAAGLPDAEPAGRKCLPANRADFGTENDVSR
ncbi:MAG: aminopeptidase [SAR324 cluster bacterium]